MSAKECFACSAAPTVAWRIVDTQGTTITHVQRCEEHQEVTLERVAPLQDEEQQTATLDRLIELAEAGKTFPKDTAFHEAKVIFTSSWRAKFGSTDCAICHQDIEPEEDGLCDNHKGYHFVFIHHSDSSEENTQSITRRLRILAGYQVPEDPQAKKAAKVKEEADRLELRRIKYTVWQRNKRLQCCVKCGAPATREWVTIRPSGLTRTTEFVCDFHVGR